MSWISLSIKKAEVEALRGSAWRLGGGWLMGFGATVWRV